MNGRSRTGDELFTAIGVPVRSYWRPPRQGGSKYDVVTFKVTHDEVYFCPAEDEFRQIIEHSDVTIPQSTVSYQINGFDCEDYAYLSRGKLALYVAQNMAVLNIPAPIAYGIAIGRCQWVSRGMQRHCFNVAVLEDRVVWVEPNPNTSQNKPTLHEVDELAQKSLELILI